jgi:hypothetical protein
MDWGEMGMFVLLEMLINTLFSLFFEKIGYYYVHDLVCQS